MKNICLIILGLVTISAQAKADDFQIINDRAYRDVNAAVSLKDRQIAIVQLSMLSALEHHEKMKKYAQAALTNKTLSENDIGLILTQLTSYYGFPRAEKAFDALADIFTEGFQIGLIEDQFEARYNRGRDIYKELDANGYDNIIVAFKPLSEGLPNTTYPLFGDAFAPEGLSLKDRQLATISALTAMGTAQPQLKFHLGTSLNVGLTQSEIMDMVILSQYYAGMPAAYNAALGAKEVFSQKTESPYQ